MSRSRLEHASLFYHLKDGFLAKTWSIELTAEPLSFDTKTDSDKNLFTHYRIVDPSQGVYKDLPVSQHRGWVYFEPKESSVSSCSVYDPVSNIYVRAPRQFIDTSFTVPQRAEESLVVVRDEFNNVIPREQYDIDYKNGRIRHFNPGFVPSGKVATSGTPSTVDYCFHFVACLPGWPENDNPPKEPFIVIYPDTSKELPLQIGPGAIYKRMMVIDVYAENAGQRTDLLDGIHNALYNNHAPVIDFNRAGFPLRHNGTFNSNFLQTFSSQGNVIQTYPTLNPGNGASLYFNKVEVSNNITPRDSRSNIGKFRGRVMVKTETYTDRGMDTVRNLGGFEEPLGGFDSLITNSYTS